MADLKRVNLRRKWSTTISDLNEYSICAANFWRPLKAFASLASFPREATLTGFEPVLPP